jgi:putative membrane protein
MTGIVAERDWNHVVRGALLLGLSGFLAKLVLTGQITNYIHPKFTWFTLLAALGFVVMAVGQFILGFQQAGQSGRPLRGRLYSAVMGVICAGIFIRPHVFGADLAAKQGLNFKTNEGRPATVTPSQPSASPAVPAPQPQQTSPEPTKPSPTVTPPVAATPAAPTPSATPVPTKGRLLIQGDRLIVTSENFYITMKEIYDNPEPFVGKRIVMDGFTFYPPGTQGEMFAVTRLVVTCHVAHAAPDGLLAYAPGVQRPAADTWHQVEGILEAYTFEGTPTVRIRIEKITTIPQPTDPYVYA